MAGVYDLAIEQGASYTLSMTVTDNGVVKDLAGYTAHMQIRLAPDAEAALIDLTDGSGITLGGGAGTIVVSMTTAQTGALEFSDAVWDLELSKAGETLRLLQGVVRVSKRVTKPVAP